MGIGSKFNPNKNQVTHSGNCPDVPYGEEYDLFVTKEVDSPYTLEQGDSNKFLIFNYEGNGILHIPDNLYVGTAALVCNIGAGRVELLMDGLETIRGLPLLGDPDGFITVAKLTEQIWQSSERA